MYAHTYVACMCACMYAYTYVRLNACITDSERLARRCGLRVDAPLYKSLGHLCSWGTPPCTGTRMYMHSDGIPSVSPAPPPARLEFFSACLQNRSWPPPKKTGLTHVCAMTHSYEWHDSLVCMTWHCVGVPWLNEMCTHEDEASSILAIERGVCIWNLNSKALKHMGWQVCCSVLQCVAVCCSVLQCVAVWCTSLHGLTSVASEYYMSESCHTYVPWFIRMCDMTHSNVLWFREEICRFQWEGKRG